MLEEKPGLAGDDRRAGDRLGTLDTSPLSPNPFPSKPAAIHCELHDSDGAEAFGYRVTSTSPVLSLCRDLVEDGCFPWEPLEAYRAGVLCLSIRSIGEAAGLEVNGPGTGFCQRARLSIAPPMRQTALAATLQAPDAKVTPAPPVAQPPKVEKNFNTLATPIRPALAVTRALITSRRTA